MYCLSTSFKLVLLAAAFTLAPASFGWEMTSAQKLPSQAFAETLAQAEAKMQAQQWAEAAALWEQVVKANPVQGNYWERLGTAYYNAKDYRRSIPAFEKQIELGAGRTSNAAYNIACNYALLGEKELAIKWLEKALAMKFPSLQHAQTDTDLQSLHSDVRFQKLVGLIDTSGMTRDEGWRTDLNFLVREIKRRGWNLFPRIGTEAEFDAQVRKIHEAIPKLTDAQIAVEMTAPDAKGRRRPFGPARSDNRAIRMDRNHPGTFLSIRRRSVYRRRRSEA